MNAAIHIREESYMKLLFKQKFFSWLDSYDIYDCKQPLFADSRAVFSGQSRPYSADSLGYQQGRGYSALLISIARCSRRKLCLLNQYGKSCRQPSPDSVKLTVTLLLVTQLISPLIWRILTAEECGGAKVIPKFYEMIQNLDPFF